MVPTNLWPTTFFIEIFMHLTSELMLKNRIRENIILMSFNIFSVKSAILYTPWPGIFQASSYMNT